MSIINTDVIRLQSLSLKTSRSRLISLARESSGCYLDSVLTCTVRPTVALNCTRDLSMTTTTTTTTAFSDAPPGSTRLATPTTRLRPIMIIRTARATSTACTKRCSASSRASSGARPRSASTLRTRVPIANRRWVRCILEVFYCVFFFGASGASLYIS